MAARPSSVLRQHQAVAPFAFTHHCSRKGWPAIFQRSTSAACASSAAAIGTPSDIVKGSKTVTGEGPVPLGDESSLLGRAQDGLGLCQRRVKPDAQMKFLPSQLAYLTTDREARGNLRALVKYLAFLAGVGPSTPSSFISSN